MADQEQLERLRRDVEEWNEWRKRHPDEPVDLREAHLNQANLTEANLWNATLAEAVLTRANLAGTDLRGADLTRANLRGANLAVANLTKANLTKARLWEANLRGASLTQAALDKTNLWEANLRGANLTRAKLTKATFTKANLKEVDLRRADLAQANLAEANLTKAKLMEANLREANLWGADLTRANFVGAHLEGANLRLATLVETHMEGTDLAGCHVYGVAAWDVHLDGAKQTGLVITPEDSAAITVDDLEVAQFIYLLLNNEKIRGIIDTITSKVVLILGRFTKDRKPVLDAIREALRNKEFDYVPVVFDFDKPASKTTMGTVSTLARMARFVIADLTDAKSVLQELQGIVPTNSSLPVQPLLLASQEEPGMLDSFKPYPWFLDVHLYASAENLLAQLAEVTAPVVRKSNEFREETRIAAEAAESKRSPR